MKRRQFIGWHLVVDWPVCKLDETYILLPNRIYHCFQNAGINYLDQLENINAGNLLKIKNFGRKALLKILELAQQNRLTINVDSWLGWSLGLSDKPMPNNKPAIKHDQACSGTLSLRSPHYRVDCQPIIDCHSCVRLESCPYSMNSRKFRVAVNESIVKAKNQGIPLDNELLAMRFVQALTIMNKTYKKQ